jgi:hypothetical protein
MLQNFSELGRAPLLATPCAPEMEESPLNNRFRDGQPFAYDSRFRVMQRATKATQAAAGAGTASPEASIPVPGSKRALLRKYRAKDNALYFATQTAYAALTCN